MLRIHDQPQVVHNAAHVFGNTLRLGILRQLSLGKDNRADIAQALHVSEDALTRQMGTLIDHGLVDTVILRAKGRPVRYTLKEEAAREMFNALVAYWQGTELAVDEDDLKKPGQLDPRSYRKRRP